MGKACDLFLRRFAYSLPLKCLLLSEQVPSQRTLAGATTLPEARALPFARAHLSPWGRNTGLPCA